MLFRGITGRYLASFSAKSRYAVNTNLFIDVLLS